MTTLLIILMCAATGFVVLLPFLDRQFGDKNAKSTVSRDIHQNQHEALLNESQRVWRAIQELDSDYDQGKLADATYQKQRIELIQFAVAIMKKSDELEAEVEVQHDRVEKAVAAFRRTHRQTS